MGWCACRLKTAIMGQLNSILIVSQLTFFHHNHFNLIHSLFDIWPTFRRNISHDLFKTLFQCFKQVLYEQRNIVPVTTLRIDKKQTVFFFKANNQMWWCDKIICWHCSGPYDCITYVHYEYLHLAKSVHTCIQIDDSHFLLFSRWVLCAIENSLSMRTKVERISWSPPEIHSKRSILLLKRSEEINGREQCTFTNPVASLKRV